RDDGIELRQFRFQLLVDQQECLQRPPQVAVAGCHDLVDGCFIQGTHWNLSAFDTYASPLARFLCIAGTDRSDDMPPEVGPPRGRNAARSCTLRSITGM